MRLVARDNKLLQQSDCIMAQVIYLQIKSLKKKKKKLLQLRYLSESLQQVACPLQKSIIKCFKKVPALTSNQLLIKGLSKYDQAVAVINGTV